MARGSARLASAAGAIFGVGVAATLIYWAIRPISPRRSLRAAEPPAPRPPLAPPPSLTPQPPMDGPHDDGLVLPPSLAQWSLFLAPGAKARGIQLPYTIRWLDMESGGNPCSVGNPAAHGPDGAPREMGVAQFYNPDDLERLRITSAELRAYCVPGDQHEILYKGRRIKGFSQALSRPLTDAELKRQADATIDLITFSMASATHDLVAIQAGPSWSPSTRNYWTLVKLQHGLPDLSHQGLRAVTKYLGRPPFSWQEFRATLDKVTLDHEIETKYRADFPSILDNAEKCAAAFVEPGVA